MDKARVVALIPAYNEEATIVEVIHKVKRYVDHVIIIDDGSKDRTREKSFEAGAEVITHNRNLGLGMAIRTGYLRALELDYDILVQLDADGQYDGNEIPLLVDPIINDEADMVLGSRLENLMYKMPFIKRLGNRSFTWMLRRLTGQDIKDGQTGFRALRIDVLETALPSNEFSYTQEMIIRVAKEGWRIKSVPIHFFARKDGESRLFGSSISFAFKGWTIILRTLRDYHPMRFFGFPGLILSIIGFLLCLYVLIVFLTTGTVSPKMPTLILGMVILLAGLQLFFTGMIADMIKTHSPKSHYKRPPRSP